MRFAWLFLLVAGCRRDESLRQSMTLPLQIPEPSAWGRVEWRSVVGDAGFMVFVEAEGFNQHRPVPTPPGWDTALDVTLGTSWHVPPFGWTGGGDYGRPDLGLSREEDGGFLLGATTASDRPEPLELTAAVLRESGEFAYHGRLLAVGKNGDAYLYDLKHPQPWTRKAFSPWIRFTEARRP